MSSYLLDLVRELNALNDDNLAERVIKDSDVQWCLSELQDILEAKTPTLTSLNEWVSVEDAIPAPGERVLATDGTFAGEAYRTSANTWYRHAGFQWRDCLQSIVTHWMPLPAPSGKDNNVPTKTPNEPLTLEQLREMDGEPVYIIIDGVEPLKMWVLIEVDGEDIYLTNHLGGGSYYEEAMELYKFKLYRRPPEGEEET